MTENERQAVRKPVVEINKILHDLQQKINEGNKLDATLLVDSIGGHLKQILEFLGKPGERYTGINPVTFHGVAQTGGQPVHISVGRLWVGAQGMTAASSAHRHGEGVQAQPDLKKNLTVVVWKDAPKGGKESFEPLATVIVDEDHFIKGLGCLFPNFELLAARPPDQEEVKFMNLMQTIGGLLG
jgi:hypothetical protein